MTASSTAAPGAPAHHPIEADDTSPWGDPQLDNWLDATQPLPTAEIVLEDLGAHSWLRSLLATLSSQYGTQQYRFVAREDNDVEGPIDHAVSGIFPVSPLQLPVDRRFHVGDGWGDEANDRLAELEWDLRAQGWQLTGHGKYWWARIFTRRPSA